MNIAHSKMKKVCISLIGQAAKIGAITAMLAQ
jgi:hypothetical protein